MAESLRADPRQAHKRRRPATHRAATSSARRNAPHDVRKGMTHEADYEARRAELTER